MRREGRAHPHPDQDKPTAKVDPTELKRLLGKAPPPPPRPVLHSIGVTELHDEMVTDVLPLVIELTEVKQRAPSIPSLAAYPAAEMVPRPYPTEKLALVPRASRPKLMSDRIAALGKHHGISIGFVLGAMLAAMVFVLLG